MPITFVGSGSGQQGSNTSTIDLSLPAHQSGDFGLVFAVADEAGAVPSFSVAGWELLSTNNPTGGRDRVVSVFYRFLDGSETNASVAISIAEEHSASVHVFRGVDAVNPFDVELEIQNAQNQFNISGREITTVTDNAAIVLFQAETADDIITGGAPNGFVLGESLPGVLHRQQFTAYLLDSGPAGLFTPPAWQHTGNGTSIGEATVLTVALREQQPVEFSVNGFVIRQEGTSSSLMGILNLGLGEGVTLKNNLITLVGYRIEVAGNLSFNGFAERLQFCDTVDDPSNGSAAQIAVLDGGTFTVEASRDINGGNVNRVLPVIDFGAFDIDFGLSAVGAGGNTDRRHIACAPGGTVNLSGVFTAITITNGLAYAFDGTSNLTDAFFINQSSNQASNQQIAFSGGGDVTINNMNAIGYAYTDRGGNYLAINGLSVAEDTEGFVWNQTTGTEPLYLLLNGYSPSQISGNQWRTNLTASGLNGSVVEHRDSLVGNQLDYATNQGTAAGNRAIISSTLNITPVDSDFNSIETVIYATDVDNGLRSGDFTPAGEPTVFAGSDIIYTATGSNIQFVIITGIFNPDQTLDNRGVNAGGDIVFSGISYNNTIATFQPNLTGLGEKAVSPIHLTDQLITELDRTIVDAYVTADNALEAYDSLKALLVDNYEGELETTVGRESETLNARNFNVVIDPNAVQPRATAFDGTTITIRTSEFDGSITTTGTITLLNGATFTGSITDASGTLLNIQFSNIVPGSRLLVQASTGGPMPIGTVLVNEEVNTDPASFVVPFQGDQPILIRVRNASGPIAFRPFEGAGVIQSTGFSASITQELD